MQSIKIVNVFLFVGFIFLIGGCASPAVVQEHQVGDQNLTCQQLVQATDEARQFEKNARHERGATGTNVAAALFFWPGLIATYANSEDAINAAQERERYLEKIYNKKNCDAVIAESHNSTNMPQETAKSATSQLYTVESISGAPAYAKPNGQGDPLYVYANGSKLTVINLSANKRWYKVLIPDGRTGFIPAAVVQAPTVNGESSTKNP